MDFEPLDQYQQRQKNLSEIEALGHSGYPRKFAWTHRPSELLEKYRDSTAEQLEAAPVTDKRRGQDRRTAAAR